MNLRIYVRTALALIAASIFLVPPVQADIDTLAEHAILMDGDSGQILWAKDAYVAMPPASMSKLMTIELLFQRLKDGRLHLTDTFPVSETAWKTGGSKGFVPVGGKLTIDDLIQRIIIVSGNDACVVVAEGIGGTAENFVSMMNMRAKQLGLNQSHFVNPNGLPEPPGQLMSAVDLAKLARHLIKDYPQYYHYFSERSYTTPNQPNPIAQPNRNLVLEKFPGADGLKTGHTDAAGYGVTASAVQNGTRMILVLNGLRYPDLDKASPQKQDWFGEQRRADEAARILGIAFREFRHYALFKPADVVGSAAVWQGETSTVPLVTGQSLAVTMLADSRSAMKVVLHYTGPIAAPIAKGQQVGTLTVTAPQYPGLTVPVYAGAAVEREGFISRMFGGLTTLIFGPPKQ